MRTHSRAPNGRLLDNLLVYGSPERGGIAAKGFMLEPSDRRGASIERLNAFHEQLRSLLALVTPGRRLQVQWACDADYRAELTRYHGETEAATNPVIREVRTERFNRYWARMQSRSLRRERLMLFLSIEFENRPENLTTRNRLREGYGKMLAQMQSQFDEFGSTVRGIFGSEMLLRSMDDGEHLAALWRFLNPALAAKTDPPAKVDPELTLQEAVWHCEGIAQPDGGFVLDGQHQAILTLARWPQRTRPGIVAHLTSLPFLDYAITVNVTPGKASGEVTREEKAVERLQGEYAQQPRPSLLVALRKKERKVEALSGGFARPFHVTYVIRVWADTRDALREKVAAVQAAIHGMDGAQYFESALPTTAKKLFFATWPGWTNSSYHHRNLYAEDAYLADLLPFSATYTGDIAEAEALYDGSHHNLVGVCTQAQGSPQHAVILGMTGAGKSELVYDLLMQTAGGFAYDLIVEEGLSHERYTRAMGEEPIVVHPDGDLTLNYLDTQGLPLNQLQVASSVALLARMVGVPDHPETLALRQAQLTPYLHQLYADAFAEWSRRNPGDAANLKRQICAAHHWRQIHGLKASTLEIFRELRAKEQAGDDEVCTFVDKLPEPSLTRFEHDPVTARLVVQAACACYAPEDFPTHSALVELMAYARFPEHPKEDIDRLATLLRAWTHSGPYGRLFDGTSNLSLQRRVVHFELGLIPEQAVELKAAAGLLISGFARQHILSLPRGLRKRLVFEEVSRFLDTPGGEQIVAEGYAQLRKFNCWVVSIVQQYARFKASRVRPAVIGNAKQFFLMRQSDRADVADLARDIGLPESALDAIQHYPMPEQLPEASRHSSACHFMPTAQPPQCGTLRHHTAPKPRAAA
jgi:type IV secretion system protein TrbE